MKQHRLIGQKFHVLDKGFVELLDFMGSDEDICNAAWVSTEGAVKKRSPVPQFLDYLMRHNPAGVFEMCEVKLKIRAPLAIARQWMRHRASSFNEISGRYVELPSDYFTPATWRQGGTGHNKQGSSGEVDYDTEIYQGVVGEAFGEYHNALAKGVAPELARMMLPVSTYTEFVWKVDLRNLLHFLKLRTDSHAQAETQEYARIIESITEQLFPEAVEAWRNHVKYAVTFSREEQEILALLIAQLDDSSSGVLIPGITRAEAAVEDSGLRRSKKDELIEKLKFIYSAI